MEWINEGRENEWVGEQTNQIMRKMKCIDGTGD